MLENNDNNINRSNQSESLNLRRMIAAYIRRWPIFLLSALFFLFGAWVYTRYLTPIYQSNIRILVKDAQKNTGTDALLRGVALQTNMNGGIDNEIQIMKSHRLMTEVVKKLNLSNRYFTEGKVIDIENYGTDLPIYLESLTPDSIQRNTSFNVKYSHPNIIIESGNRTIQTKINQAFTFNNQKFAFFKTPLGNNSQQAEFKVITYNPNQVANFYKGGLSIGLVNNYSTVLNIGLQGSHKKKSEDILTKLVQVYNVDAKRDKSIEFDKTIAFIESRIQILSEELGDVELDKQSFQQKNDIANLPQEIGISIGEKSQYENELLETETQLSLVNSYKNHVNNQSITEVLPNDISSTGGATNSSVAGYNQLVMERNNLLADGATANHPRVKNLEVNIQEAKTNILNSIQQQQKALATARNNISSQLGGASSFKQQAPSLERLSRDIDRQQHIKESLYLLLLQKREEAEISKAITDDKIKIIDPASSYGPVSPVKSRYYLGALAIGLLLPFAVTFIQELLKNKIETRSDLEELVNGEPIVAELPKISLDEEFKLVGSDLSVMSEAFRIMRTNIEFVISRKLGDMSKGKVILVTSSIKGEGKTFVAMNYAHVLGQLKGKRAIIVGADIRNPQLHRYDRSSKKALGLTEYLYDEGVKLDEIINVSKSDGRTNIIFSGRIPPNPTELLMSPKFDELIEELASLYDYVVVDSAPLVLVSDTYHISSAADLTVYVTRSEFTPRDVLKVPMDAIEEGRLKNVVFALNDISTSHSGYAYGYKYNYGYGYGYGTVNRRRSPIKRALASIGINLK